jgi:hypothetical protein
MNNLSGHYQGTLTPNPVTKIESPMSVSVSTLRKRVCHLEDMVTTLENRLAIVLVPGLAENPNTPPPATPRAPSSVLNFDLQDTEARVAAVCRQLDNMMSRLEL